MAIEVSGDQLAPLEVTFSNPLYLGQVIELDFSKDGGASLTSTEWVFHLRQKGDTGLPLMTKTTTGGTFPIDGVNHLAQLRISTEETSALEAGVTYEWEVWLIIDSDRPFMAAHCKGIKFKAPIAAPI